MVQRLRITFISHYFFPEGNAPASRVHEMCKRWVRDGHDVTVITGAPNAPAGRVYDGYRNRAVTHEEVDGIKVVRVWTYIAANKGTFRRILNYLSFMLSATLAGLLTRRPDVLIATSPQFFCGLAGLMVAECRQVPFVLEIRDIWPESIAAVGAVSKRPVLRVLEWLERLMYRRASHIVTVGQGYKTQLLERGVPEESISIITNGVDPDVYMPAAGDPVNPLRAKYGLNGQFLCGYVGTIGMACGLDVVLRAGELLKAKGRDDVAIILVGDGAVREDLESRAKQLGLINIIFAGQVGKHEVPAHLQMLDACLVHLRRQDLFRYVLPSKIFEAAAMEKPIVLGVAGYAAELIEKAGAGVTFEPENAEQLVAALEQLAANGEQARRFGESGRRYVMQHFDRDQLSKDYLFIIERTMHGGAGVKKSNNKGDLYENR